MDLQQIIVDIFESKIFISLISLFFGIFLYWFYLYIKELKSKYDFSDELRDVVNKYIKNGEITVKEFGALIRIVAQMGNYLGIYKEHVQRMIKEFGENGGLNFSESIFDEKEHDENNKKDESNTNDLDKLLKENLELKKQLMYQKRNLIVDSIDDNENAF
ncbi:hypothetical protein PSOLA_00410 [Candidatus Phytoplasma solani]|uniref:hypothetical protein n=1 Tax=Candidatus Phytoplasma solani TaxID=69896 RepID=UPI0003B7D50A|nr:hypothetical protein [Candidatus Phytoplasma solani]CCP88045.1 hypothetical protein S284_01080 [Candidatus Phytoplasma solani]CCP88607.1 conserved hypothetical protein [Candidatus Phytoplasma solani]